MMRLHPTASPISGFGFFLVLGLLTCVTGTAYAERVPQVEVSTTQLPGGQPATPVITASAPAEVPIGSAVTVTAKITGADTTGEIVVLEALEHDTWTGITSTRIDDNNDATLSLTPGDSTYSYRLRLSTTTRHQAATSDAFTIDVSPVVTDEPSPTQSPAEPPAGVQDPSLCGGATLREDGSPWVCTYDDEFDGDALDRRYWVPQVSAKSGFYTGTDAQPACVIDDPRTIGVSDGNLALSAIVLDQPMTCGSKSSSLASGMVTHHGTFSQTYGKYEVRAKLPDWTGKGLQETFWLWPNDPLKYGVAHPSSGEIDFAEFYSNYSDLTIPVMHYLLYPYTINYTTNTNVYTSYNCTIRVGEYNTYGVEWYPGQLKILVNGKVCITNNYIAANAPPGSPYAPFDSPFFLSLTQAFGTTGNEFDPATGPATSSTEVDWVRIWE